MRTIKLLWYDIKGFFYIRSVIQKNKNTVDFQKFGLRYDWVNRIYTVINPSEADKGDSPDVIKIKAQDKMVPIHKYIDKLELAEFVSVSVEKIPNSESYLLVYYPIINVITTWRVTIFFLLVGVGIWLVF
jgi:hypothetical protein